MCCATPPTGALLPTARRPSCTSPCNQRLVTSGLRVQQLRWAALQGQHATEPVAQGLFVQPVLAQQRLVAVQHSLCVAGDIGTGSSKEEKRCCHSTCAGSRDDGRCARVVGCTSSSRSKQVCAGHTRIPGRWRASHLLHAQTPLWARPELPCGVQFFLLLFCSHLLLQCGTALPGVQGPALLPACSAWLFDDNRKRVERKCHLDSMPRLGKVRLAALAVWVG